MILAKVKKLKTIRLGGHVNVEHGEATLLEAFQTLVWDDDVTVLGVDWNMEIPQLGYGSFYGQLSKIGTFQDTEFGLNPGTVKHGIARGILSSYMFGMVHLVQGAGPMSDSKTIWCPDGTGWDFDEGDALYLHMFLGIHVFGFFECTIYYIER